MAARLLPVARSALACLAGHWRSWRDGPLVQRITHSAQFKAVLAAKTLAKTAHFALHQAPLHTILPLARRPQPTQTLVTDASAAAATLAGVESLWGSVTPKRWAKRAVTRNAIKRQIFAAAKSQGSALQPAAYVVRLRAGFDAKQFPSARSAALGALLRAELGQLMLGAQRP